MKKLVLLSLLLSNFISIYSQNMSLDWANILSDTRYELGFQTAVDSKGKVYLLGLYYGRIELNSSGDTISYRFDRPKYFIQKLDADGNQIWFKNLIKMNSGFSNYHANLFIDTQDNLYISGLFTGKVDADPGPGIYEIDSGNSRSSDAFLLKLDEHGNFVWAQQLESKTFGEEYIDEIAVDSLGNVYMAGYYRHEVDFDPGPMDYVLKSAGKQEAFILKVDANGNFLWVKTLEGAEKTEAHELKLDPNGEPLIAGVFRATVDFDPGPNTFFVSAKNEDFFLLKLSVNGEFKWMRKASSTRFVKDEHLLVDHQGNSFLMGSFSSNIELDSTQGGTIRRELQYLVSYMFIQKFSPLGEHLWVQIVGRDPQNRSFNVINTYEAEYADPGSLLLVGYSSGDIDYDPGPQQYKMSEKSGYFVSSYDAQSGDFLWGEKIEAIGLRYSDLASDSTHVYLAGSQLYGTEAIDHDPSCGVFEHEPPYYSKDIVMLKWKANPQADTSCLNVSIDQESLTQELPLNYYPNPSQGPFQLEFNQSYTSVEVEIYSMEGRKIKSLHYASQSEIILELPKHSGLYLLRVIADGKESRIKVIRN